MWALFDWIFELFLFFENLTIFFKRERERERFCFCINIFKNTLLGFRNLNAFIKKIYTRVLESVWLPVFEAQNGGLVNFLVVWKVF